MKYRVVVETIYGLFEVEVVAESEEQAFDIACQDIKQEIDCAKVGSIDPIETNSGRA